MSAGNAEASHTPPPPLGGRAGEKGAAGYEKSCTCIRCPAHLPMKICAFLKIFRKNRFWSKKYGPSGLSGGIFPVFQLSNQKKYGRKNFNPTFFAIFLLSRQKFSGPGNFAAKKVRVF